MAIIETKYNVGDIVYTPSSVYEDIYETCPDCLGNKKLHITFADHSIKEIDCYTCKNNGWPEVSTGKIKYKQYSPKISTGPILNIYIEGCKVKYTVDEGYYMGEDGNSYRYQPVRDEENLFLSKDEAITKAEKMNLEQMAYIAECNFKKKNSFVERLEKSNLRYCRAEALKLEREMKIWIKSIRG